MNKKIVIYLLFGVILAGGGFFGGMTYQKSKVPSFGDGIKNGAMGTPPTGMGAARNGQSGGGDNSGEITSKDDESITIKLSTGSTKTIYYSDSTKVAKSEDGSKDDLSVGTTINAMGTSNSDGSVSAQIIQIQTAK